MHPGKLEQSFHAAFEVFKNMFSKFLIVLYFRNYFRAHIKTKYKKIQATFARMTHNYYWLNSMESYNSSQFMCQVVTYYFPPYLSLWDGNYSLNENTFYPILPIAFTFAHLFYQILTHLPKNATEIAKFLETFRIWNWISKKYGFFFGKNMNFSKSQKLKIFL